MTPTLHLLLPRLVAARASAVELASTLPPELDGLEVTIDASLLLSASQGFADELVRQIFGARDASSLAVGGATLRFAQYLQESAERRGFSHRIVIDCTEVSHSGL